MKKRNLFWGIIFLLAAIFIIVAKLGYLAEFSFFSLFFTVFLLGILIDSLIRLNFPGIFFSAAFLFIIYNKQLGITELTPWTVLGAALLASIGCWLLFHKKKGNVHSFSNTASEVITDQDNQNVYYKICFGTCIKYVNTNDFKVANLKCVFGELKVYFDNAVIQKPGACIDIDVAFGELVLYIPKDWHLHISTNSLLAEIKEKNKDQMIGSIDVHLTGSAKFSEITIRYI